MHTECQKWLINLFVEGYNAEFQTSYKVSEWPEETLRQKRLSSQPETIDALATDAAGRALAIEHTRIEAFVDATKNDKQFAGVSRALSDPSLRVPGFHIVVHIPIQAVDKLGRGGRSQFAGEIKAWFSANCRGFPEGRCHRRPTFLGRKWTIFVDKYRRDGFAGCVTPRRYPKPPFLPRMHKALHKKVKKLVDYGADRSVLLFERQDYDSPGQWDLTPYLNKLERSYDLSRLDEVWLADMAPLLLDNCDTAWFHLVWPRAGVGFVMQGVKAFSR